MRNQPTGGVILLKDNTPSEEKVLLELKAKKSVQKAAAPAPLDERILAAYREGQERRERGQEQGSGAAEAAGVLTAVDEDEEGEEAEVPRDFDYVSDGDEEAEG